VDGRTTVKTVRFARRRRLRGMNLELCEIYRRLGVFIGREHDNLSLFEECPSMLFLHI